MKITVFTPTYNRAGTIERLYHSLQKQSFKDFEWLVIDDGSTDNTRELFERKWCSEKNDFPIRYFYSTNKGKMKEMNVAMDLAEGDLFFTVDSDDWLVENALKLINEWDKEIPHNGDFCGFAGRSGLSINESPASLIPEPYYDTTLFARYSGYGEYHIYADRAWVFYTEIYRKYKFPEYENENFITEAVSWNRMANDGLKVRCFNEIVYQYEFQEDGLTNNMSKTLIKNPRGYGLWLAEMMKFMNYNFAKRMKQYYVFYSDLVGNKSFAEISEFIQCPYPLMILVAIVYKTKRLVKRRM